MGIFDALVRKLPRSLIAARLHVRSQRGPDEKIQLRSGGSDAVFDNGLSQHDCLFMTI